MMRPFIPMMLLVSVAFFAVGCGSSKSPKKSDDRLAVIAGIPPLAYLVEQIGGERVRVDTLVRPGQDPHTFEPDPKQIQSLGEAAIFFKIDMPFESVLLEKIREGNPKLHVVDATSGISKRPYVLAGCGHDAHDHHDHAAVCGALDPHVWLAPPLLKTMARNILEALVATDPEHREEFQDNLAALDVRIDELHEGIEKKLAPYRGRTFVVFHPGFGYFADTYGLKEEAVEAGGREPAPRQLNALLEKARAEGITTIFVQPQYQTSSAQAVASAIGGHLTVINGLDHEVLRDIEDISEKLAKSFGEM